MFYILFVSSALYLASFPCSNNFVTTHGFPIDGAGLLCLRTIVLCGLFHYRKQATQYASDKIPPENRLYETLFGSFEIPIGLFWFADQLDRKFID